ncbi:hypothetical protein GW17_00045012 [Ensete ventricosum]|nr:hypothetical protein GW17_00045012 [Ensete ventricosum]
MRPPARGCVVGRWDTTVGARGSHLRASFCTRPLLDAAAVSRSWQTHVRLPPTRVRPSVAWAVDSMTTVVSALCAHVKAKGL